MAYYTCDDCGHYDKTDINRYGEYFCTHFCKYYPKSDKACSHFEKSANYQERSNCFLTTTICNIFGMDDDCYGLNVMRNFRDTILVNDSKYYPLLAEYEFVGPEISKKMLEDENSEEVASYYFENYIYDILVNIVINNDYEKAVSMYVTMVNDLKRLYGISKEVSEDEVMILSEKIINKQYKNKKKVLKK